jgi:hypothetical protein
MTLISKLIKAFKTRNAIQFDEEQQVMYNIVQKLCANQTSIVTVAPGTGHYYVENKANGYFIVLSESSIKITNHKFYLVRHFDFKIMKPLLEQVLKRIETDCANMENEIFSNELDLLYNIENSIS